MPLTCLAPAPAHRPLPPRPSGLLLGNVSSSTGVVEVTHSFGVYYKAKEGEVAVSRAKVAELIALHKAANDKEGVVGWYSTLGECGEGEDEPVGEFTLVVHSFFAEFPTVRDRPTGWLAGCANEERVVAAAAAA